MCVRGDVKEKAGHFRGQLDFLLLSELLLVVRKLFSNNNSGVSYYGVSGSNNGSVNNFNSLFSCESVGSFSFVLVSVTAREERCAGNNSEYEN